MVGRGGGLMTDMCRELPSKMLQLLLFAFGVGGVGGEGFEARKIANNQNCSSAAQVASETKAG